MVESMHSLLMPLDLDEDDDDSIGTADEEEACWWRYLDDYQRGGPVFMSPEACFYGQSCHFRSTCSRHHSTFLVAPGLITPATCFCEDIWCCAGHPLRDVAYQALSADERRSFAEQYMRERAHFGACYQTSLQQAVLVALLAHPGTHGRVASKLRLELSVPCGRPAPCMRLSRALRRGAWWRARVTMLQRAGCLLARRHRHRRCRG